MDSAGDGCEALDRESVLDIHLSLQFSPEIKVGTQEVTANSGGLPYHYLAFREDGPEYLAVYAYIGRSDYVSRDDGSPGDACHVIDIDGQV